MKMSWMIGALLFSTAALSEESKPSSVETAQTVKMTTTDAKKACKDEGKTGADLLKCMKEKKGEK